MIMMRTCSLRDWGGGSRRGGRGGVLCGHVSVQAVPAAEQPVCRTLQAAIACPQRCLRLDRRAEARHSRSGVCLAWNTSCC